MSFSDGDCLLVYIKKRGIAFFCAKVASYQEIVKVCFSRFATKT